MCVGEVFDRRIVRYNGSESLYLILIYTWLVPKVPLQMLFILNT